MTPQRALQHALNFLMPFQEAGSIYDDYLADEGITDGEYQEMLDALEQLIGESIQEERL